MTASNKPTELSGHIEALLVERSWTQQRLAAEIGITQGHLSKLKRGLVPGSAKIVNRVDVLRRGTSRRSPDPWLDLVLKAGKRSRDAKLAMEAIARIVHKRA